MNLNLCLDSSEELTGSCKVPRTLGFTFAHLMTNCSVSQTGNLFSFNVEANRDFDVEIKDFKVVYAGSYVTKAEQSFFR